MIYYIFIRQNEIVLLFFNILCRYLEFNIEWSERENTWWRALPLLSLSQCRERFGSMNRSRAPRPEPASSQPLCSALLSSSHLVSRLLTYSRPTFTHGFFLQWLLYFLVQKEFTGRVRSYIGTLRDFALF